MQAAEQINFFKLQNLKHWACHLQGWAGQVEVQSPDKTQESSSYLGRIHDIPSCGVLAVKAEL